MDELFTPNLENSPPDQAALRARSSPRDTVILSNDDGASILEKRSIPLPEFYELSALIAAHFGIKVENTKRTLISGRIIPLMEKYGFANHRDCLEAIKSDTTGQLLSELANRISTNHTAFYREEAHFTLLRDRLLPELVTRKNAVGDRDIRIWCAACATGEEAYTILFTLHRFFNIDYGNWRSGVLATDISAAALDTARQGVYNKDRVEVIPKDIRLFYFNQNDAEKYEVKPEFRKEVTFRRLNLMNDIYPFKQPFDFIFCRNVMIYFSRSIRQRLLEHLYEWLTPRGCLFIGHSESLGEHNKDYENIAPATYIRSK
ncbi:MAG: protein-glutamate O-methyltransferase CheR [Planctomycetes bacterium]|nr:protein-glutamate O-methyltransferase CheR [Planctomycetota bacterium]